MLTAQAWMELLFVDMTGLRGFCALKRLVTRKTLIARRADAAVVAEVIGAVNCACAWYFRAPKCLQRSAAVTRMLRSRGVPAEMLVGYIMPPLKAHAWVEVSGRIVAEDVQDLQHYHVLDRW